MSDLATLQNEVATVIETPLTPYGKLGVLAELQGALGLVVAQWQSVRDAAIPQEVKAALAAIDESFTDRRMVLQEAINETEADIKAVVLGIRSSVKGEYYHAVYNKGRTSWDTARLDGYAAAHPEILPFRKVGEPYVTIKESK